MLGARLPDEGAHVDQSGRDHVACAIDDEGIGGRRGGGHRSAQSRNFALDDEDAAEGLALSGGIDQARVDEDEGAGHGHGACA